MAYYLRKNYNYLSIDYFSFNDILLLGTLSPNTSFFLNI